jgi:hypothetical protein
MGNTVTLRIPRELRSPNAWLWKHWRIKQRERETWEQEIAVALLTDRGKRHLGAVLQAMNAIQASRRTCDERRRVTVTRLVPSRRNFIKDDDNLRFSVKPVNDALKRLGLIHSDSRQWLEQSMPMQEVSPDGTYATIIEIERLSDD